MAGRYIRTVEESKAVIKHGKLDENDIKPITQVLYFSDNQETERYKLMELDANILNVLDEGQRLVFKGNKDEHAVLCTKSQTFEVREAETSNSLLLLPKFKWSEEVDEGNERTLEEVEVVGIFHKYLELQPCIPQMHKLRELLKLGMYRGPEFEEEISNVGKTFTFEELSNNVQASEDELRAALKQVMACSIEGKWRMLENEYHFRVLSLILGVLEEHSWPFNAIYKDEIFQSLKELVPYEILSHCFYSYAEPSEEEGKDGKQLYYLEEAKVCRFLAETLLRTGRRFRVEDFLLAWRNSVPEGMLPCLEYLDGLALLERSNEAKFIVYFPEEELPNNISERFSVLFETREKWTFDEIRPYVERLTTGNMNVGTLLTKYARTSTQNGVKCYTAKHSK